MKRYGLGMVMMLCLAQTTHAQFAVFDASVFGQTLLEVYYSTQTALSSAQEVVNGYEQIRQQVTMVSQGAQNLTRLNLSQTAALLGLSQELQMKLSQAQQIGYQINTSVSQLQNLYPRITQAFSPQQARQWQMQSAGVMREAARVSVQVQSISTEVPQMIMRITQGMQAAQAAAGNLDVQQAQAQLLGNIGTQLAAQQQMHAANGRMLAIQIQQEAMAREQAIQVVEQAMGDGMPVYAGGQGQFPQFK